MTRTRSITVVWVLVVFAVVGMCWRAKEAYWYWGYERVPGSTSIGWNRFEPFRMAGWSPPDGLRWVQLTRRFDALGGPASVVVIADDRGEVCRATVRSPRPGEVFSTMSSDEFSHVLPVVEARHWRSDIPRSARDTLK